MIIGGLIVLALILGGILYKNSQKDGVSIEISESGIDINEN